MVDQPGYAQDGVPNQNEDAPAASSIPRPPRRPHPLLIVLGMVVAVLAFTGGLLWLFDNGSQPTTAPGPAPSPSTVAALAPSERAEPVEVTGVGLDGEPLSLAELRGRVVVVNVWGSWCVPCREEAPALSRMSKELAGQGVSFIGINVRDNVTAAKAFERRYGITYPSFDDPQARAVLAFQGIIPVQAVPSTVVLDREGRVAARVIGVFREPTLRSLIDTVVREAGSGA